MPLPIDQKLPRLGAASNLTTVSGMSSGGFMAVQMHVIYSALFVGAGIFAGGPYDCTQGIWANVNEACTVKPELIDVDRIENIINSNFANASHPIDDPKNLENAPVFIYSGILDTVVMPGVVDVTNEMYKRFNANVQYVNRFISEHVFPTDLS
jgi:predicted esterase